MLTRRREKEAEFHVYFHHPSMIDKIALTSRIADGIVAVWYFSHKSSGQRVAHARASQLGARYSRDGLPG